jgi:threonine aldolase
MSDKIDLRSDTVTRPVRGMRDAIASARVGDDVFGDDPTVIELESRVAGMYGAEAAMFVPSGTMGNLISLLSLASPGDEIILDRQCHVFNYECASVATFGGVQTNPLDGDRGVITAGQIESVIRDENLHLPVTSVIAVENTHNRAGGRIYPFEELRAIKALAGRRGLRVHLDGARLANAHVETGISFADYYTCADTISMCFSKGLGAPVGSIIISTGDRIAGARKIRKRLGGGMRQAGVLAAAALYALDNHIERLRDDHRHAKRLAGFIEKKDGLQIHQAVETNIVIFRVDPDWCTVPEFLNSFADAGVLAVPFGPSLVRMVTHLDVSAEDIERAGEALAGLDPH